MKPILKTALLCASDNITLRTLLSPRASLDRYSIVSTPTITLDCEFDEEPSMLWSSIVLTHCLDELPHALRSIQAGWIVSSQTAATVVRTDHRLL